MGLCHKIGVVEKNMNFLFPETMKKWLARGEPENMHYVYHRDAMKCITIGRAPIPLERSKFVKRLRRKIQTKNI